MYPFYDDEIQATNDQLVRLFRGVTKTETETKTRFSVGHAPLSGTRDCHWRDSIVVSLSFLSDTECFISVPTATVGIEGF